MGSSQSAIPIAAAFTGAAVAGAVIYGTSKIAGNTHATTPAVAEKTNKKRPAKAKKRSAAVVADEFPVPVPVVSPPTKAKSSGAIPGGFNTNEDDESSVEKVKVRANAKKGKKKATKTAAEPIQPILAAASVPDTPLTKAASKKNMNKARTPPPSTTDDGSWTQAAASDDDDVAETIPASAFLSAPNTKNVGRKPLAERLLPKARKTAVDDMLEKPDQPIIARVMRVSQPGALPAAVVQTPVVEDNGNDDDEEEEDPQTLPAGYRAEDYDDVPSTSTDDDDGWGVVPSKTRKPTTTNRTTTSSSLPTSSSSSQLTKRQRQNASKRDAQKATKAQSEAERLAILARHKRQLEQERIAEFYKSEGKGKKAKSGGMNAVVEGGRVVWE